MTLDSFARGGYCMTTARLPRLSRRWIHDFNSTLVTTLLDLLRRDLWQGRTCQVGVGLQSLIGHQGHLLFRLTHGIEPILLRGLHDLSILRLTRMRDVSFALLRTWTHRQRPRCNQNSRKLWYSTDEELNRDFRRGSLCSVGKLSH